jgi:hypothetical protein
MEGIILMTDKLCGVTVFFESEISEEDARPIVEALKMIKGVATVQQIMTSPQMWFARFDAKCELRKQIYDLIT